MGQTKKLYKELITMSTYTLEQVLDPQAYYLQLLKTIDDAILGLISGGFNSYSIEGRTFTALNLNDLKEFREEIYGKVLETAYGATPTTQAWIGE
jgi:hypothetical protein